jgi:hypothetical protein
LSTMFCLRALATQKAALAEAFITYL